ncbi:MAG TPA: outer membrane lipoprotein-sorting protein [Tangfeifania sp.]|nr:outer membrane lipoprotein-sorting protein [Tangfeifania sp.]
MKRTLIAFFILLIAASVNVVEAQTLQDVLNKHFEAIGQDELLEMETYEIEALVSQMGMEIPMEIKMKRPNKFRMEMEVQGQKMVQAYNGEKGWMLVPGAGSQPQELSGPQLEQAMEQADIDGELYNYEKKGYTAELLGKEFLGDDEVFNIKLTGSDGVEKNYYIGTDNYLVKKVVGKVNSQGQEVTVEQIMSDYENINGVMVATKIESKSPMGSAVINFKNMNFGAPLDNSIFEKP